MLLAAVALVAALLLPSLPGTSRRPRQLRLLAPRMTLHDPYQAEAVQGIVVPSSGSALEGASSLQFARYIWERAPCLREAIEVAERGDQLAAIAHYDALIRQSSTYLRPSARSEVRKALEVAFLAHLGQSRRSGEPYITHPVEVAAILGRTQMDRETVCAGLLHDTVEDTALSFEEIGAMFGPTVSKIVEGETKVSKLPKMVRAQMDLPTDVAMVMVPASDAARRADEQVENLRSMFVAMAEDWRIVVVKLADRLHNMRTLEHMPVEKRVRISRETLEIYAPLAHRLGMWSYKTELADLAFSHLFPREFAVLDATVNSRMRSYQNTLRSAKAQIEEALRADEWLHGRIRSVAVTGRTKSTYSTWKKMQRLEDGEHCGIERINDLVALRVVLSPENKAVDGIDDVQRLVGRWTSSAAPVNGSSSSAALSSLLSASSASSSASSAAAASAAAAAAAAAAGGEELSPFLKAQLEAEERALCYHVLGKVHGLWTPLPRTLKDYISSPKPNGYASLHTTVLVGTQTLEVQIRTLSMHRVAEHGAAAHWAYKDHGASLPWLQIIRQWHAQVDCAHEFVQLVRDELLGTRVFVFTRNGRILNLAKGATLADAAAQLGADAGMPGGAFRGRVGEVNGSPAPAGRELANGDIVSFEPPSAERRMLDASGYELTQLQTARRRQQQQPQPPSPPQMQPQPSPPQLQPQPPQPQLQAAEEVVADATDPDDEAPGWAVCAVCKPLPGDELAGTRAASRGGGGAGARTLHRRGCGCRELQKELELESNAAANAADADDDDDAVQRELSEALAELRETDAEGAAVGYEAQISVFCEDRRGMMMDVASVCTDVASNIVDVHSETRDGGGAAVFQFTVQLHDAAQLARLVGEMVGVPSVTRVVRSSMKELKRDRSTRAFWALAEPGEGTRSEAP